MQPVSCEEKKKQSVSINEQNRYGGSFTGPFQGTFRTYVWLGPSARVDSCVFLCNNF